MTQYAEPSHRVYLERARGAHAAYTLHYHLVWSVKARHDLLVGAVEESLVNALLETGQRAQVHILALHVEPDHVHLLISLRPDVSVAKAVQRLKGATAHSLRQAFPHLVDVHSEGFWSAGYFARTLGDITVAQAKAYLDRQRARHKNLTHHGNAAADSPTYTKAD